MSMPELRQNLLTREWVIIAKERARRPEEFKSKKEKKELPEYKKECPFCPGNEKMTPYESFTIQEKKGWKVRVIPNKFPALASEGKRDRHIEGIHRFMSGVGIHEVIIESPLHNLTTALMPVEDVRNILVAYRERYLKILKDERIEMIIIFKNHGESAGTSLEHPHSQLIGTPLVPTMIRYRNEEAMRYFDDTGECVGCKIIKEELTARKRIVWESEYFVAFIPYGAYSPFHTWLFPRRHVSSFGSILDKELEDLASVLKTVLAKLYHGLDDPDFNYCIRSIPSDIGQMDYLHWYISIIPRLTRTAGFELGSGMFINTSVPEESAGFLREMNIPY